MSGLIALLFIINILCIHQEVSSPFTLSVSNSAKIRMLAKKEIEIDGMTAQELVNQLKDHGIPTFGTMQQRKDRLKKKFGM